MQRNYEDLLKESQTSGKNWLKERAVRASQNLDQLAGDDFQFQPSPSFDPAEALMELNTLTEDSPEWNLAMINFLLNMKAKGHNINEIQTDKVLIIKGFIWNMLLMLAFES